MRTRLQKLPTERFPRNADDLGGGAPRFAFGGEGDPDALSGLIPAGAAR